MATSCAIIKKNDDGSFSESSVRSDGYLGGVGAALFKHYQDPAKIDRLLALGWVSPLEAEIEDHGEGETFDGEYPRRWEADQREACLLEAAMQGEVYLFEDGKWYHAQGVDYCYETFQFKGGVEIKGEITREYLIREGGNEAGMIEYLGSTEKPVPFKDWFAQMQAAAIEKNKNNPRVLHLGNMVMSGDFTPKKVVRQGVLVGGKFRSDGIDWHIMSAARADRAALSIAETLVDGDQIELHAFQEAEVSGQHLLVIEGIRKL